MRNSENTAAQQVEAQAIAWAVRIAEPEFDQWDELMAWMEQSAAHAKAVNDVLLADAELPYDRLNPMVSAIRSTEKTVSKTLSWPRFWANSVFPLARSGLSYALAMGAAVLILVPIMLYGTGKTQNSRETGLGETENVALAEGISAVLNSGSKLTYASRSPTAVSLDAGEAYFSVEHHPDRVFEVAAGDVLLRDKGTKFNVIHSADFVEVTVSEGAVEAERDDVRILVQAGQGARFYANRDHEKFAMATGNVGSWTTGRLIYVEAPLARVAQDITRRFGVQIALAPGLASTKFTGRFAVGRDADELLERIAPTLGVRAIKSETGWTWSKDAALAP